MSDSLNSSFCNKLDSRITEVFAAINVLTGTVLAATERSPSLRQGENRPPTSFTDWNRRFRQMMQGENRPPASFTAWNHSPSTDQELHRSPPQSSQPDTRQRESSSLDSWRSQLEDSDRRFYQNLAESDRRFYQNLAEFDHKFYRTLNDLKFSSRMRSCEPVVNQELQLIKNPKELQIRLESLEIHEEKEVLKPDADEYTDESKVIPNPLDARMFGIAIKAMGESGEVSIDSSWFERPDLRGITIEFLTAPSVQKLFVELPIKLADFRVNSIGFSEFMCAHKVFVVRSWQNWASQGVEVPTVIALGINKQQRVDDNWIFDPGIVVFVLGIGVPKCLLSTDQCSGGVFVFDPGIFGCLRRLLDSSITTAAAIYNHRMLEKILVFDPGIDVF